jgi:hypothetical protein
MEYQMHTFTTIIAVVCLMACAASGGDSRGDKMASDAMTFESRHLSLAQCDSINNLVGRNLEWGTIDVPFIGATATAREHIYIPEVLRVEPTPAWVSEIQQKGVTYQAEKQQKAVKNQERLSTYSATELSIAENMGLNPWNIERKQLRRWGSETDSLEKK